ncbi:MAG: hypothetical protein K5875_04410 [Saccharofermentans sp.]|nr:hypothetical protein [Saccharofermentans sp.]
MPEKQTTINTEASAEIKKLESKIKTNTVAIVITQIITAGIIAGGIFGMTKAGFALLGVALFFAALTEIFSISLIKENKNIRRRIEIEKTRPASNIVFADPLYKNKGYTYPQASELYCRQTGKRDKDLTPEDKAMIRQYSYDDFAYLLMWIIENDLYRPTNDFDEDEASEAKAYVAKIKRREALPTDYLESYEGYFMEDGIRKKARPFVISYFKGSYEDEVREFARENLNSELYGFPFRWEDYDAFKAKIDAAYKKFQEEFSKK